MEASANSIYDGGIRAVIPAGGRGSRTGLPYPKTLHTLNGLPILVYILRAMQRYDVRPILIINPAEQPRFDAVLVEHGFEVEYAYQEQPLGMGHALMQAANALRDAAHALLLWSDIPLMSEATIEGLVNCHLAHRADFSLATAFAESCYTVVHRDEKGRLLEVRETRAHGLPPAPRGERDTGLFIFRPSPVLAELSREIIATKDAATPATEIGFLPLIGALAASGARVEGYPIARPQDLLSFNTMEELQAIEALASSAR